MKITFEQYVSPDKTSSRLKTVVFESNGNTQEEKEAFLLEILEYLGITTFPNGSTARNLFEAAVGNYKFETHNK